MEQLICAMLSEGLMFEGLRVGDELETIVQPNIGS